MKSKMPYTLKCILLLLLCFVIMMAGSFILEENADSAIGMIIMLIGMLWFFSELFFLFRHFFLVVRKKLNKNHKKPETKVYSNVIHTTSQSSDMCFEDETINKVTYVYNSGSPQFSYASGWGSILMCCFVLLPLGLFHLLKKASVEKDKYFTNGNTLLICGIIISAVFIPLALLAISVPILLIIPVPYSAFGIFLIVMGIKLRKTGRDNDRILTLITNDKITNIYTLMEKTGYTYAKVTDIAESLIDIGFLMDAYVFHRDSEIIVPGISKKLAFKCKNCASTSLIYTNEERICEYCGSRL